MNVVARKLPNIRKKKETLSHRSSFLGAEITSGKVKRIIIAQRDMTRRRRPMKYNSRLMIRRIEKAISFSPAG